MTRLSTILLLVPVLTSQVLSYENMYDILDRKNERRLFEPRSNDNFDYRSREDNRFSSFNRRPTSGGFSSILQNDRFDSDQPRFDQSRFDQSKFDQSRFDQPKFDQSRFDQSKFDQSRFDQPKFDQSRFDQPRFDQFDNRRTSVFGNGYDNLGNGVSSSFGGRRSDRDFFSTSSRRNDPFRQDSFSRGDDSFRKDYGSSFDNRDRSFGSYGSRPDSGYERSYTNTPDFYRKDYFTPITRPVEEKVYKTENKNFDNSFERANGEQAKSGVTKIDSIISNNEDQKQKKTDAGFHNNEESSKKDVSVKEKQGETQHYDRNGENKSSTKSNKIAKKGHSTKGFSTHHHKDETGNTTTFYDESSDHGGQYDFRDIADEFGNKKFTEQYNGKEDGKFFKENGGKSGNYGAGVMRNNQKTEKDIVSNNQFYDKGEKYGGNEGIEDVGHRRNLHYLHGGNSDSYNRRSDYY